MDTRKFEYLETIRETIEQGDYDELQDFVDDIREAMRNDQDFEELFQEVRRGRYQEVVNLIDDIIYKEMQEDFDVLIQQNGEEKDDKPLSRINDVGPGIEMDESLREEISFEPFDEEGYLEKGDDDSY